MKKIYVFLSLFLIFLFFVGMKAHAADWCSAAFKAQCSDSGEGCTMRCWQENGHNKYHCYPQECPQDHPLSLGEKVEGCPPGANCNDKLHFDCTFCGNWRNCYARAAIPTNTPTPMPATGVTCLGNGICNTTQPACRLGQPNCYPDTTACRAACPVNSPVPPSPTVTQGQVQCQPCNTHEETFSCPAGQTHTCTYEIHGTNGQCTWYGPGQALCGGGCTPCVPIQTSPSPTTPAQPTPGECMPGRTCTCSGEGAGHCNQCGGEWCNGGQCTCAQPPGPPHPTNTPTPTPIQPSEEITMPPTPTVNPAVPTPTTGAGGTPVAQLSQRWVCLDAAPCSGGTCSGQGVPDHRVQLKSKVNDAKPLSGTDTYIFECLRIPDPNRPGRTIQKCSTGVLVTDMKTVGGNVLPDLQHSLGYKYNGIYKADGVTAADNPVPRTLNNNGDIGIYEWESYTQQNVNHMFLAMNWFDPNGPGAGNDFTQKQGTLGFDTKSKKCVMIRWDPEGIVFDSKSLEPIEGAEVTLLKKLANGKFVEVTNEDVLGGGLQNPYTTGSDGLFSFYVPDGTYKLMVKKNNYSYPVEMVVDRTYGEYKYIYYGQEFTQKGKNHEFDIPLDPDIKAIIAERIASLIHKVVDTFIK